MAVARPRDGRGWRGIVRDGRRYVSSATFPTQREAKAYVAAERAKILAGRGRVDVKAPRRSIQELLPAFYEYRKGMVAQNTADTDNSLLTKTTPQWLLRRSVGSVMAPDIERALAELLRIGAWSSMKRYRDSLRAFMKWARKNGYRYDDPFGMVSLPKRVKPVHRARPWTEAELLERFNVWLAYDRDMAYVALFQGEVGTRWSEARALKCSDVSFDDPFPSVLVERSKSEHSKQVGPTKNKTPRRAPLPKMLWPYIRERIDKAQDPEALLFPPLWHASFVRRLHWKETGQGRTVHRLRACAICNWIRKGTDLVTVRGWAGHADLTTTSKYVALAGMGNVVNRQAWEKLNIKS
jgi:integrase